MVPNEQPGVRIALVTKGHPFDRAAFFDVFDQIDGLTWDHFEHPDAMDLVEPGRADPYDAFVMYDMPGLEFTGSEPPVKFHEPPENYRAGLLRLLDDGFPLVFLHHAIGGWPAWEEYAHIVGGRFHYQPATLAGLDYPDSGYRHDVTHTVEVIDPEHPICAGLDPTFTITDELYLCPTFDADVQPLLRSRARFVAEEFYSADLAIRGQRNRRDGWTHPPGSNLVAWTHTYRNSPIAYLQFGDGPATYADPTYRRVIANAIRWAASQGR